MVLVEKDSMIDLVDLNLVIFIIIKKYIFSDNRRVADIAIGSEHTLCLADDNMLWAWGWNEHANTGTNMKDDFVYLPTQVLLENHLNISKIYAGGAHNFVITDVNMNYSKNLDEKVPK